MPTGQTALVVPVPEADPLVGPWRERHDKHAAMGVPAHITLLSPFLPPEAARAALAEVAALLAPAPETYTLAPLTRWPGLAVLEPLPADWFRTASQALCTRYGLRPYEGRHGDIISPHLTVAYGDPDPSIEAARFDAIAAALDPHLPLRCVLREAWLLERQGDRWRRVAVLPLR